MSLGLAVTQPDPHPYPSQAAGPPEALFSVPISPDTVTRAPAQPPPHTAGAVAASPGAEPRRDGTPGVGTSVVGVKRSGATPSENHMMTYYGGSGSGSVFAEGPVSG